MSRARRFKPRASAGRDARAGIPAAMKAAALVLSLVAVAAFALAIRDMVLGVDRPRRGWALRALAVAAFVLAVLLNVLRSA